MTKPPVSPDLPPPNLTATDEETTRCNTANRPRKLIIKCGHRMVGCTTDKDVINANTTGRDDSGTGLQQSPLEPTLNSKRRKKNNAEPKGYQSHAPWIAPSLPPTLLHDLTVTREKLMHDFKTSLEGNFSKEDNHKPLAPTPPVATAAIAERSPNGLKINESICDDTAENVWKGRTRSRSCNKKERPPFRFALTESEIEEDFLKMTMNGNRPPPKQKKQPRNLQKQLDIMKLVRKSSQNHRCNLYLQMEFLIQVLVCRIISM
ncbi:uncharacterized protein [Arachis hypogaea]|uniref:uncharacterized protein n=1 Tax=Arachis hypogaea TaxID=3818 RepID=UPI000A2C2D51|nr:uncharacterized protein LOC112796168 [Arachis hypogaea]XP_025694283.1 uncharacterized protein LOC112796168 [Arachis hypogaea]QHO37908.1 uncharacterized protein DS421_4g115670 [Arachis hypogaea]QHO37909.1 uncharacterized protein DS421_4g115670 [Arachis hypogaea]